eukprot:jgi/Tetstr1/461304/TSEL_006431.t1
MRKNIQMAQKEQELDAAKQAALAATQQSQEALAKAEQEVLGTRQRVVEAEASLREVNKALAALAAEDSQQNAHLKDKLAMLDVAQGEIAQMRDTHHGAEIIKDMQILQTKMEELGAAIPANRRRTPHFLCTRCSLLTLTVDMTVGRALGTGVAGALAVLFGKSAYEAFRERQTLSALQGELSFHRRELARLEKDLQSNRAAVDSLKEQQKTSGSALASLESELSAARKAVTDLEAQYAAQVTAIGAAKELLAAKSSLITDLDKLRAAKEGKVAALSPQVETQAAAVAAADRAANPLNHPLVKQFFK